MCGPQACKDEDGRIAVARAAGPRGPCWQPQGQVCVCARARVLFSLSRSCARALSLLVSERERASEREFVRMLPSFGKEMRGRGREGMRGRGGRGRGEIERKSTDESLLCLLGLAMALAKLSSAPTPPPAPPLPLPPLLPSAARQTAS